MPSFDEEAARARAAQQLWAQRPIADRLHIIRELRHLLVEQADRLALTVTQDIGRPAGEVLATDILPVADALLFLEKRARGILKPKRVSRSDRPLWLIGQRETIVRQPRGVVGFIGTWNYPIFLNAVPLAQALVAGNGVLWKPSELTPALAIALHELFLQSGFPPDLLIRLPESREAGPLLVESAIDHLIFIGSDSVGRRIAQRLGERLISSSLELSGCDALVVAADADPVLAAKAAWFGTTLNKGQTCLAIRRIFVERTVLPSFLDALRPLAASAVPEPLELVGQAKQAERLVQDALASGGTLLNPSLAPQAEDEPPRFPPTFVLDAKPEMALCREASFAPIAGIIPVGDLDEAIRAQTTCPFSLGASIFTRDHAKGRRLAEQMGVGTVSINDVIVGTAHPATPFGGRRSSGWGVLQGEEGLMEMTVPLVICERGSSYRPHYNTGKPGLTRMLEGMLAWKHGRGFKKRLAGFWKMLRNLFG